tara:strand:- start:5867 stop:8134 length:2268 start_codon:yes stop_codon:yes gene_type:complete
MIQKKKNLFIILSIFSFQIFGQVIDDSILENITTEQIEQVKEAYETDKSSESEIFSNVEESTISLNANDSNIIEGRKYGYDFFSSMPTSLSAVGDLPLPNDYKISLRDQLSIILSGAKDDVFDLNVKLDGTILFPELGSISVVGLTFGEVSKKISNIIQQSFIGVNVEVSLKNLSAKKITIVGAVKTPGTYLVNPFSTITGALAYSGGISEIGTLRKIKLIRNNGDEYLFDLYDLLIRGDRSNDITIEAGDTILINAADKFIEINGGVNRPAIYEVLQNETLEDIIEFSLGFADNANVTNISISNLDTNSASIVQETTNNLSYDLRNTISVDVFNYVNELKSDIEVLGAIDQPGFYSLSEFQTLEKLINNLTFVDEYPWLAVVEQFDKENLVKASILFSLKDKNTYKDIKLLENSKVIFANLDDRTFNSSNLTENLIKDFSINISFKGVDYILPVFGKFKVEELVDFLGLDMSDVDDIATYISPLENKVITQNYREMQFTSSKYQAVSFRSPINDLIKVTIEGAVDFPGEYTLMAGSKISDIYLRAGNLKSDAFSDGVIFIRSSVRERQLESLERSKAELNRSILSNIQQGQAVIDLNAIRSLSESINPENLGRIAGDYSPNSIASSETILFDGDQIIIPRYPNTINVLGEVLNPVAFEYSNGLNIRKAIEFAGGYRESANKSQVYIIRANGLVVKQGRNVFAGNGLLKVLPGDTIIVPRKINVSRPGFEALVPITSILSNLAFSAAAIDNLSNN